MSLALAGGAPLSGIYEIGAVPTGLFDQRAIDAFLVRLFATGRRSNDFRTLERKLFLVATNLDTGEAVTLDEPGVDHVPINRAIAASAALPGLFPPVLSYFRRRRLCEAAYRRTLQRLLAQRDSLEPLLAKLECWLHCSRRPPRRVRQHRRDRPRVSRALHCLFQ